MKELQKSREAVKNIRREAARVFEFSCLPLREKKKNQEKQCFLTESPIFWGKKGHGEGGGGGG